MIKCYYCTYSFLHYIVGDFLSRVRGWVEWFDAILYPSSMADVEQIALTREAMVTMIHRACECPCDATVAGNPLG